MGLFEVVGWDYDGIRNTGEQRGTQEGPPEARKSAFPRTGACWQPSPSWTSVLRFMINTFLLSEPPNLWRFVMGPKLTDILV